MAKLNVTVDNSLEDIKLESSKNTNKKEKVEIKKEKKPKKGKTYFSAIIDEMKKVTWPTRKNMVKYSIATVSMIVVLALFFVGLSALFDLLYGLVRGWM